MSRRMRVLAVAGSFVVALLLLELGARVVVAAADADEVVWYDASTQLRVDDLDELGHTEIVFAGTSSAWQGFVPGIFIDEGVADSSYNVGLAGGVPAVTAPWLRDEVIPRLEPDVLVWGLTSLDFSSAYGDSNQQAYEDAFETRQGMLADLDRAVSDVSDLVGSRRLLRSPSKLWGHEQDEIQDDLADAESILGTHGERLDFTENVSDQRAAIMRARVRDYAIDPDDVEQVRATAIELQGQGRTVVFVEVPFPDRFVALHPNGAADIAAANAVIDQLGEELGIRVVRTTETFTNADFVDFSHLDADAAARFSADIARQLTG